MTNKNLQENKFLGSPEPTGACTYLKKKRLDNL